MRKKSFLYHILTLTLLMPSVMPAAERKDAEDMTLPIKKFKWKASRSYGSPVKAAPDVMTVDGKQIPCMKYTLKYVKGATFQISLRNMKVDMKEKYPYLTVYFESDKKDLKLADLVESFTFYGKKDSKTSGKFDGLTFNGAPVAFHWAPASGKNTGDMSRVSSVTVQFRMDAWTKNETMTLKVSDFQFSKKNNSKKAGGGKEKKEVKLDPKRLANWKKWLNFRENFKPDYSDSTPLLGPPKKGRLKKPLPLAVKGEPMAEIIVHNPDKIGTVNLAAEELQHWIKEISGAELPIVTEPSGAGVRIHLNSPEALEKYAKEAEFLRDLEPNYGEDGFFIRTAGNDVYISGITPKGVLNGACRFLENNTSIIWARPVAFGTVYNKDPNLTVKWGSGIEKPRSFYRGLGYGSWGGRNGGNFSNPAKWMGKGHLIGNFSDYLPNEPPFQCYVDGEYHPFGYYRSQVCISQPASFPLVLDKMMQRIKASEANGVPVSIINWVTEDNWLVCTCDKCTAPITLPDGRVLRSSGVSQRFSMAAEERFFRSCQFYAFANRLAKELDKERPGIKLHVLAYFFMETAPGFPLEKNIMVTYAPLYTRGDYGNPVYGPSNDRWSRNWDKLREVAKYMNLYEYYFHMPTAEVMKEDMRYILENGGHHIGSELTTDNGSAENARSMDFNNIDNWIFMRLSWDYTQDVEQLRKYYLRRVFHEGAPVLEKFYGTIRQHFFHTGGRRQMTYNSFLGSLIFPDGKGEEYLRELKAVLPKIKNPTARINFLRFIRTYEGELNAWLIKTGKKQAPDSASVLPEKEYAVFRNTLLFRFSSNDACSVTATTLEYRNTAYDGIRFHFKKSENEDPNDPFTGRYRKAKAIFRDKAMGYDTKIPVPGIVKFKVRVYQPVEDGLDLPKFGVASRSQEEMTDGFKDVKKIENNLYQYSFYPENLSLQNDVTWLIFQCFTTQAEKGDGFRFDIFDVEIVPAAKKQ